MATVRTIIHTKEYILGCDDGQEAQLLQLTEQLSARCKKLSAHLGRIPESLLLVYAALTFIDEAQEAKKYVGNSSADSVQMQQLQDLLTGQLTQMAQRLEIVASAAEAAA